MPSISRKKRLQFHESTQRALCRMAFFCFALLPIFAVGGYSLLKRTPWYQSYQKDWWERRLSDNLGVNVSFASIEFPSPNKFRVKDLVCANAETGRQILKVAQVTTLMDRSGWYVEVDKPELNGAQIETAMRTVHDRYLCRPQSTASLLGLAMTELVISDGNESTKFQNVKVTLKPTEPMSELKVSCLLDGQKFADQLSYFVVERDHVAQTTNWKINSADVAIPCRILSERFLELKNLGSQASFRGSIEGWQNDRQWEATVRGQFLAVDLAVVSTPYGKGLQGMGELNLAYAVFRDGKLRGVDGGFKSNSCIADTAWLDELFAQQVLRSTDGDSWRAFGQRVTVNGLGIRFKSDTNKVIYAGATSPPLDMREFWPDLAAYAERKPIAFHDNCSMSLEALTLALSAFPNQERIAGQVASGRR
ncbi:MAG: hypothetical protein NTY15_03350 [Planctomycetota bacterium]|nr:hypothetical protein [Planctomycetota bacterium]